MRKACSTQSLYSDGVRSPTMSERPRISVLRLRQLSTARFYDGLDERRGVRIRRQPPPRMGELAPRSLRLARLEPVARGGEVVEAVQEIVLAEPEAFRQRAGGGEELAALEVSLDAPADGSEPRVARRPLV